MNICWAQLDKYGNFGAEGKYFKNFETIRASEVKTISIFLKFVNKYDEEFSKRLEITDYDTKDFCYLFLFCFQACFASSCIAKLVFKDLSRVLHLREGPELRMRHNSEKEKIKDKKWNVKHYHIRLLTCIGRRPWPRSWRWAASPTWGRWWWWSRWSASGSFPPASWRWTHEAPDKFTLIMIILLWH